MLIRLVTATLALAMALPMQSAFAQRCGDPRAESGYGPWNYRNAEHRRDKIPIVERRHFTRQVERLQSGESGYLGQDLNYTLNTVPNHHRALQSMMRLALRENTRKPRHMSHTVTCWFERARTFAPEDGTVWMIEGMYLHERGDIDASIDAMNAGLEREPNNANIHYNLALVYLDANRPERALEHARTAYEGGFPLQGLRQRLAAAGYELSAARSD